METLDLDLNGHLILCVLYLFSKDKEKKKNSFSIGENKVLFIFLCSV